MLPFPDPLHSAGNRVYQFYFCHRLLQIINGPCHESSFYIVEIIISADYKRNHIRIFFTDYGQQIYSVHKRHINVRNQDIRHLCFHLLQHIFPVRSRFHKLQIIFFPLNHVPELFSCPVFVVRNQNFILPFLFHFIPSPFSRQAAQ